VVERLPLGAGVSPLSDNLNAERERLERGLGLIQLYGVYTEVDCIFDTRNLISVWDKLSPAEQKTFPFDPALYTWDHYMKDVHIPTVLRMSRQETAARRGKQPTGSTLVKAAGDSVRSAIERRSGRSDVLAVFDVDGTLVETNVVEYFLWMRLRAAARGLALVHGRVVARGAAVAVPGAAVARRISAVVLSPVRRPRLRGDAPVGTRGVERCHVATRVSGGHAAHPRAQARRPPRAAVDGRA